MMSKERELLQRCLDEFDFKGVSCPKLYIDINKLLAQPEPKPVAYRSKAFPKGWFYVEKIGDMTGEFEPLYLDPPDPKTLSAIEQMELHEKLRQQGDLTQDGCWDAIEVFKKFLQKREIYEYGPN